MGRYFSVGLQRPSIADSAIEYALNPVVIGKDPFSTKVPWNDMYARTRGYGRKGVVVGAISAIDIALSDIC